MDIDKAVEELNQMQQEYKTKCNNTLHAVLKEYFNQQDKIKMISFRTWIPAFNDGEPCEFTCGGYTFLSSENTELLQQSYDYEFEEDCEEIVDADDGKSINLHKLDENDKKLIKSVSKLLNTIALEEIVGCNTEVFITKDGIRTEEYYCDY